MAICPKCSYSLVFLEKRMKYKCAKCGRLYLQRFIDDREFQRWNEKQREFDRENLKPKRILLTEEERKQRLRESQQRYRQRNREKILSRERDWYRKNREKYNLRKQKWRQQRGEQERMKYRIRFWRKQQKALALQACENVQEKAYNADSLAPTTHYPTFLSTVFTFGS